ncbi:MAG: hypothetical protein C4297_06570 [Gemmataceae bacterium]
MFVADLIRLGGFLLAGGLDPREIVRLLCDAERNEARKFYEHVFVVHIPGEPRPIQALPMQEFGEWQTQGKKKDFQPHREKALAAPFTVPVGGNPRIRQGYYVSAYICYGKDLEQFPRSRECLRKFLEDRFDFTVAMTLDESRREELIVELHREMARRSFDKKDYGLIVLACTGPDACYSLVPKSAYSRFDYIGALDDLYIVPNYERLAERLFEAKLREGKDKGTRTGPCTFTDASGEVLAPYNKAWTWALPEWSCPLPGGNEEKLVEGWGMSPQAYKALTLGASILLKRLSKPVYRDVTRELFAPVEDRLGKEAVSASKRLPSLFGSAFLLPIHDRALQDRDTRDEFVRGMRGIWESSPNDPNMTERHLHVVVGFDVVLPEELEKDDYRLSLLYYSGDPSCGDVHIRAYIEDVLPSTLRTVKDIAERPTPLSEDVASHLLGQQGWAKRRRTYLSVPQLLARAYGGAFLWQQLDTLLHRRRLDFERPVAHTAHRLLSLVPKWPESKAKVREEVFFFLYLMDFVERVNSTLAPRNGGPAMPLRSWPQLLALVRNYLRDNDPAALERLADLDDPAELGFLCGTAVRRFSDRYYRYKSELEGSSTKADFLRDRVLSFGSCLRPETVRKALRFVCELPRKLPRFASSPRLEALAGACLHALQRSWEQIQRKRDDFIVGFWSGYALWGYKREPHQPQPAQSVSSATDLSQKEVQS